MNVFDFVIKLIESAMIQFQIYQKNVVVEQFFCQKNKIKR